MQQLLQKENLLRKYNPQTDMELWRVERLDFVENPPTLIVGQNNRVLF